MPPHRIPGGNIGKYWEYMDAYISLIPNNLIKIWRTDNNGQLSRNDTNSQYVGKWTLGGKLENPNSQNLSRICENNEWVALNTFFIPVKNDKSNLATWYSSDGNIANQLDYIIIEDRYSNWDKEITNNIISNPISPMQHRAIILELKNYTWGNYFENTNSAHCPYDLNKARTSIHVIKDVIGNIPLGNTTIGNLWQVTRKNTLDILAKYQK